MLHLTLQAFKFGKQVAWKQGSIHGISPFASNTAGPSSGFNAEIGTHAGFSSAAGNPPAGSGGLII
ncbi:MAG: hypothetical protein A3H32_16260 [Betaproteobacteria bacterium RIFCSPLOWO2_02_FULL_63_19]|nr:MAG: hypothetical protein A3H32_16260 [Betaproteobacteria bacterium RIFCSPLOWO2_02_FULL_63_19]